MKQPVAGLNGFFLGFLMLLLIGGGAVAGTISSGAKARPEKLISIGDLQDDRHEIERYQSDVEARLYKRAFDSLDAEGHILEDGKRRFLNGNWKLTAYYNALCGHDDKSNDDAHWLERIHIIEAWRAHAANSVHAALAEAAVHSMYGWQVRGSSMAGGVTSDGWAALITEAHASETLLDALDSRGPIRDPYYIQQRLRNSRALSQGPDALRSIYFKLRGNHLPYDFHVANGVATGLVPKWGGQPDDVQDFCLLAAKNLGDDAQCEQLTRALIDISHSGPVKKYFEDHSISWGRIHHGFEVMFTQYPHSLVNANYLAYFAWAAGDYLRARVYLDALDGRWDPAVWGDDEDWHNLSDGIRRHSDEYAKWGTSPSYLGY